MKRLFLSNHIDISLVSDDIRTFADYDLAFFILLNDSFLDQVIEDLRSDVVAIHFLFGFCK